jgi:pyrimidine operon attenuation protein/uracil phosphoribosyltransferase
MQQRTLLLDDKQVIQRLNRLAWQIYEDNVNESSIVLAGIMKNGFIVAEKIAELLKKISPLNIILAEVHLDKHSQNKGIRLSVDEKEYSKKSVVLIDDVLNSGKTIMYALRPFLEADIKKIRTVVLINRNHKRFPVSADFSGLSLSTTHQEHIDVVIEEGNVTAWLS